MTSESLPLPVGPSSWLRGFFERICLAGWVAYTMTTTVLIGLTLELLIFHFVFMVFIQQGLINQHTYGFLGCGALAMLNFPLVMKAWSYGARNLHFEYHQSRVDAMTDIPESMGDWILRILDENSLLSVTLERKVEALVRVSSPAERQVLRHDLKAWITSQRDNLSPEDRQYILGNLGYMLTETDLRPQKSGKKKPLTP